MDHDLVRHDLLRTELLPEDHGKLPGVHVPVEGLSPEVLVRDLGEVDSIDPALAERLPDVLVKEEPNGLRRRAEMRRDDLEQDGSIPEFLSERRRGIYRLVIRAKLPSMMAN
ncbi:MAG: hypothetical protein V3W28_04675 [Thermoplasmata archaeon]